MSTQEKQTEQERKVEAQGEQEEDVNSVHDECHVSNRHMTWWHNARWIRVDNWSHMRSARGRRRTWRAARQAAEQVRDGNRVGEKGRKGRGRKAEQKEQRSHLTPNPTRLTTASTATTAGTAAATSRQWVWISIQLLFMMSLTIPSPMRRSSTHFNRGWSGL